MEIKLLICRRVESLPLWWSHRQAAITRLCLPTLLKGESMALHQENDISEEEYRRQEAEHLQEERCQC